MLNVANFLSCTDSDSRKNNPRTLVNICARKVRNIYTLRQIWELRIPRSLKVYINMEFPWSYQECCDYLDDKETSREIMRELEEQTTDLLPDIDDRLVIEFEYLLKHEYYKIFNDQLYCSSCFSYMQTQFLLNNLNVKHDKISYNTRSAFSDLASSQLDSICYVCTLCKCERLFTVEKVYYLSCIIDF